MSRFSLIVPLLDQATQFENTLASVLRYRTKTCQIIVAHDGDYDDPYGLGKEVDFVAANDPATSKKTANQLISQFNAGVRVARGEFVALLRPGVQLTENWDEKIEDRFADPDVASVAPVIVSADANNQLLTAGVTASSGFGRRLIGSGKRLDSRRTTKLKPLGPTSWAAFYRRSLLNALGECDVTLDPHYLDLDLALSFSALDFKCAFSPDCVVTTDEASLISDEARLAHGRSAQRATTRFGNQAGGSTLRLCLKALGEIATSPWRPANLKHALQRFSAGRHRGSDEHHRELLELLSKQRQRLVTPNLRLHDAPEPASSLRRAA